jgi:sporulation protein YabP
MEQNINLKNRSNLKISGIEHIYSFDEKKVELKTSAGDVIIEGEGMEMSKLSIDENVISIDGTINSIVYSKVKKSQEGFFKKVFK